MFETTVCLLARPARFERAAFRLGGGRSIRLSYGRITTDYYDTFGRNCQALDAIQG